MIYKFCNLILRNKMKLIFNNGPIAQLAERHGMRRPTVQIRLGPQIINLIPGSFQDFILNICIFSFNLI